MKFRRMPYSFHWTETALRDSLDDRDRNFAAGEEARVLTVIGDQVRLGETLEEAFVLKRPDRDAEIVLSR